MVLGNLGPKDDVTLRYAYLKLHANWVGWGDAWVNIECSTPTRQSGFSGAFLGTQTRWVRSDDVVHPKNWISTYSRPMFLLSVIYPCLREVTSSLIFLSSHWHSGLEFEAHHPNISTSQSHKSQESWVQDTSILLIPTSYFLPKGVIFLGYPSRLVYIRPGWELHVWGLKAEFRPVKNIKTPSCNQAWQWTIPFTLW